MNSTHLQQWIQHPESLDRNTLYELRTLVARYPYFQSIRLLYLKNLYLLHDINFGAELRKSALYVANLQVLFYLIEGERYKLKPHQALDAVCREDEASGIDRTLFLIDAFLATVPEEHPQDVGLDYAMDYTAYLMQEEPSGSAADDAVTEVPKLRGQELIDGFLRKEEAGDASLQMSDALPEVSGYFPESEENPSTDEENAEAAGMADVPMEEGCLTETLAKIYVKQHRYEKALEIIKKLSLNYPKKNAYFADQIRFLEKLIINAKSK